MSEDHPILQLIRRRSTREHFDPDRALDTQQIRELVRDASRAPSSFNLQHSRFLAVRRPADKDRLRQAAYGQDQVANAAVTFIILGDLRAVEMLPSIMDSAVEHGALQQSKAAAWVRLAREIYADLPKARDEAIRSASLSAMTMMFAAEARGMVTAALSGFDVEQVQREFGIEDRYVPVMLLAVGYPCGSESPRMPRLEVSQVLAFDHGPIAGRRER